VLSQLRVLVLDQIRGVPVVAIDDDELDRAVRILAPVTRGHLGDHVGAVDERKLRQIGPMGAATGTAASDRRSHRRQYDERNRRTAPRT